MDDSKYSRLNPDSLAKDINEFTPATDLDNLQLLVDYKFCLTYKGYREVREFSRLFLGLFNFIILSLNRSIKEMKGMTVMMRTMKILANMANCLELRYLIVFTWLPK